MSLSQEKKNAYLKSWSGKTPGQMRTVACVAFGTDAAKASFPELFEAEDDEGVSHAASVRNGSVGREVKSGVLVRAIGKVRWYNGSNNHVCGIVYTNNLGTEEAGSNPSSFIEVEIHRGAWKDETSPVAGVWVIFSLRKERGRFVATKVVRLDGSSASFRVALQYTGKFSRIKGEAHEQRGGSIKYDDAIISKSIACLKRDRPDDWHAVVRSTCRRFVESFAQSEWTRIVDELIEDAANRTCFGEAYFPSEEYGVEDDDIVTPLVQKALADMVVASGVFDELTKIPAWYGLTVTPEMAREFLGGAKTEKDAERILSAFDESGRAALYPDVSDADVAWLRRVTLWRVTGSADWLKHIRAEDFESFVAWLLIADDPTRVDIVWDWSDGASAADVAMMGRALDSKAEILALADRFLGDDTGRSTRMPLLNLVSSACATRDVSKWCELHKAGLTAPEDMQKLRDMLAESACGDADLVSRFCAQLEEDGSFERVVSVVSSMQDVPADLCAVLFAQTGVVDFLNEIDDVGKVCDWLNRIKPERLVCFLRKYADAQLTGFDAEDDAVIAGMDPERFADALRTLPEDERYQFILQFPRLFVLPMVCANFAGTKLFDQVVGEEWARVKSSLPYAVFDLESDGESIREFAFIADKGVQAYVGEDQLNVLLRALRRQDIIVGHNVKTWDIGQVLSKKGFQSDAFVWDTLEIEILLNPCRYAYSLHTTHVAKDDVELTDRLFWNQLLRLSKDDALCKQLKGFLPASIGEILCELRQPQFATFFQNASGEFFNELKDVDERIVAQLREIESTPCDGETLIVAPKALWGNVAKYVSVEFPEIDSGIDYFPVSIAKVRQSGIEDVYQRTILERFVSSSLTPVVGNIAQYLRLQYFPDDLMRTVVANRPSSVKCIDVDALDSPTGRRKYGQIVFLGCELGNRLDQHSLSAEYEASDFLEKNLSVPLRLASSSYTCLVKNDTCDERSIMRFDGLPVDAHNVWVERTLSGKYRICYNYDYSSKVEDFLSAHPGCSVTRIDWTFTAQEDGPRKLVLVRSADGKKGFDSRSVRVGADSRQRAAYWCYQLELLEKISERESGRPIVYVLENDLELELVKGLAASRGFFLPSGGSVARCIESIRRHSHSLLVISRADFNLVANLRQDVPLCFVWDEMAVEKCRMMWYGQMPFGDEAGAASGERNGGLAAGGEATPRAALLAAWPLYEYYYRFVSANCQESTMYVVESCLEDYSDLSDLWNVDEFSPKMWTSEESYKEALSRARKVFKSTGKVNGWQKGGEYGNVDRAMETIKSVFIPGHDWRDDQKAVLPKILARKCNCLISIPTGGGKSVLFQGPALYNSMLTNRLSVVVTPLKALMEDQVLGLQKRGFFSNVDYISGDRSHQEIQQIYRKVAGGEIALLYVAPERFRSRAFQNALMTRITNDGGWEYFVFDEAHCVSQWGQEFRPEYLYVIRKCAELQAQFRDSCVTLYSATVTKQIEEDIRGYVGNLERMGQSEEDYNPIRNHIGMSFSRVEHSDESRISAIVKYVREKSIDRTKSRMLVFCRTRKQTEEAAAALSERLPEIGSGSIGYFHAGMDADERSDAYENFKKGRFCILCATKAFGMGMDIPNVHYVVHYSPPSVLEDYLQEVGRAGRDAGMYQAAGFGQDNRIPAVCLFSVEDFKKAKEMLKKSNLSWLDLLEIDKKIFEYIAKVQPEGMAKDVPVVIPNTLWHKEELEDDTTAFKIGMFWLERLGRIRMGYLCPAHLDVSLVKVERDENGVEFATRRGQKLLAIAKLIVGKAEGKAGRTVQVSLSEIRQAGKLSRTGAMDLLVKLVKMGVLRVERPVMCRVANLRRSEVSYMFRDGGTDNRYALHLVFETARNLLRPLAMRKESQISLEKRNDALAEALAESGIDIKQDGERRYMPWWERAESVERSGLALEESYEKDLRNKRAKHVFSLIEILPGIKFKSELDAKTRSVLQLVTVREPGWDKFLDEFETDCLRLLKKVNDNTATYSMDWAQVMADLGLDEKGYGYFEDLVRILRILGYIVCGSLLPFGIEVLAGSRSDSPMRESYDEGSDEGKVKCEFDRISRMRDIRLASIDTFSRRTPGEMRAFISKYFSCVTGEDFNRLLLEYNDADSPEMAALREEAIKNEEDRLDDEQRAVYTSDVNENINVIAGPGSGKTHILTLRCAKLIYRQNVRPERILALAYNRAVVVELRNRLDRIFAELGLTKSASHVHVCTFHALAKTICGSALDGHEMNEWEQILLTRMRKRPNDVRRILGDIRYVMIDEFQDITQTRLEAMFQLKEIYPSVSFFTIGDKNQSIYGFDKKIAGVPESTSPDYYYRQLDDRLSPRTLHMRTNYRSYQKILDEASVFLDEGAKLYLPRSAEKLVKEEPGEQYVRIVDSTGDADRWFADFDETMREAAKGRYRDVAVFFRTNAEVYRGYAMLKGKEYPNVRLRVQGASTCELWRTREMSTLLRWMGQHADDAIELAGDKTKIAVRKYIEMVMEKRPAYDHFYLDFVYTLVMDFLESVAAEERTYTFGEMASEIKEAAGRDDCQLYKIYDRYRATRILTDDKINVVLTTMHKVKGLEFDSVVITPGHAPLPLGYQGNHAQPMSEEDREELLEERRLMYVAYTRARKSLRAYRGIRERSLNDLHRWGGDEASLGYHDGVGLEKLYLSYLALDKMYQNNDFIKMSVVKNGPVVIEPVLKDGCCSGCRIKFQGRSVGYLSAGSKMRKRISKEGCTSAISGFFVNEVFVWNYADSLDYDLKNHTTYSKSWCDAARKKGFIYLVDFAGFGKIGG